MADRRQAVVLVGIVGATLLLCLFGVLHLRRRLGALQDEMVSLRSQAGGHTDGKEAAKAKSTAPDSDDAVSPEAEKQHMTKVYAALDSRSREARDQSWSGETEASIAGLFKQRNVPKTDLESAVCSATVCRIALKHQSPEAQKGLAVAIIGKPPVSTAQGVYYQYLNDRQTILYLIRPGVDLVTVSTR